MADQTADRTDFTDDAAEGPIERGDTGIRMLLTILFAVAWAVLEAALGVIVVFSLVWALITRQAPPLRLREFSNRLVTYAYRIGRYITYNEAVVPFPFSDFPQAAELPDELGDDAAAELKEQLGAHGDSSTR